MNEKLFIFIVVFILVYLFLLTTTIFVKLHSLGKRALKQVVIYRSAQTVDETIHIYESHGWLVKQVERVEEGYKITLIK